MTIICHLSTLLIALTTIMNGLAILYMRNRFDELYCRINFLEIKNDRLDQEVFNLNTLFHSKLMRHINGSL